MQDECCCSYSWACHEGFSLTWHTLQTQQPPEHLPCILFSQSQNSLSCQVVLQITDSDSSSTQLRPKSWSSGPLGGDLQVAKLQERLSDSNSLTARLKRELLLVKAKAEALEFAVSAKDAEIELLHARQDHQDSQVRL